MPSTICAQIQRRRKSVLFILRTGIQTDSGMSVGMGVNLEHSQASVPWNYLGPHPLLQTSRRQNKGKGRSQEQHPVQEAVQFQMGNSPGTIRSTTLAMCYSEAEYACHVWGYLLMPRRWTESSTSPLALLLVASQTNASGRPLCAMWYCSTIDQKGILLTTGESQEGK